MPAIDYKSTFLAKKIAIVLAVAFFVAIAIAVVISSMSAGSFSLTIEQVLASGSRLREKDFRVSGRVVPGSIKHGSSAFETVFAISDESGKSINCIYRGSIPDPFAEGREVILQGRMTNETNMEVSRITVKCPSKYREAGIREDDEYYLIKYKKGHEKM